MMIINAKGSCVSCSWLVRGISQRKLIRGAMSAKWLILGSDQLENNLPAYNGRVEKVERQ